MTVKEEHLRDSPNPSKKRADPDQIDIIDKIIVLLVI
jgi:hypothetical protein